ncbi:MAG: hypothetical protein Rhims3KO_12830 [Hyphomicrobiales bacterium]
MSMTSDIEPIMGKTMTPRRLPVRPTKPTIEPETFKDRLVRYLFATAYAVQPKRIAALPPLAFRLVKFWLTPVAKRTLPANDAWLPGPECTVGFVHDASPEGILAGLREGMHPSAHISPIKWLAPRERCILVPQDLRIEKNLARLLRKQKYRISFDRDPLGVLNGCAAPRPGRPPLTWLTPEMKRLLMDTFDAGIMHTTEVHDEEGKLVGGLFGYAVDDLFMIQSQFHTVRDTSKIATVGLMAHLTEWGFTGADGDYMTTYLGNFGFKTISRGAWASMQTEKRMGPLGLWNFNSDMDLGNWKPAEGKCPRKAA